MAVKDQCERCSFYSNGICQAINGAPVFDQTSCQSYKKSGIILDKKESVSNPSHSDETSVDSAIVPDSTTEGTSDELKSVSTRIFSAPFSFNGRIRRLEYLISFVLYYIYAFIDGFIVGLADGSDGMMYLLLIPGYWFFIAQSVKRCHDRGNSGWYIFIPFYILWLMFGDGEEFENDYGPDPKGRNIFS